MEVREVQWGQDSEAILEIEKAAFIPEMRDDGQYLEEQVDKGFGLVVYHDGKAVAYVIAVPLEKTNDFDYSTDPNCGLGNSAYIESLAVIPNESTLIFRRLAKNLVTTLQEKGFQRVTMHVETDSKWCKFLIGLGCRVIEHVDNWQGWGKTFSYLEYSL